MKYGRITSATITDKNDHKFFAQVEGVTFEVVDFDDNSYRIGEEIEGIIYEDREGKKMIQVSLPVIREAVYGWTTVISSRKDLGVFVDIGLKGKDAVISLDDLPENPQFWPKKGDRLYITYTVDKKNRFWARMADYETIETLFRKAHPKLMNQPLEVTIFKINKDGYIGISKEGYRVFIHNMETPIELRLGQIVKSRVTHVGKDQGVNASLKLRAHEAISDDAQMIIAILSKSTDQFLPLHDKSTPEEIEERLGISKGQFKRAVGNLLKNNHIKHEAHKGIYLL